MIPSPDPSSWREASEITSTVQARFVSRRVSGQCSLYFILSLTKDNIAVKVLRDETTNFSGFLVSLVQAQTASPAVCACVWAGAAGRPNPAAAKQFLEAAAPSHPPLLRWLGPIDADLSIMNSSMPCTWPGALRFGTHKERKFRGRHSLRHRWMARYHRRRLHER